MKASGIGAAFGILLFASMGCEPPPMVSSRTEADQLTEETSKKKETTPSPTPETGDSSRPPRRSPPKDCATVESTQAAPLALPDGNNGSGVPRESKVTLSGFPATQTMKASSDIAKICMTVEHSSLRDLEISLVSPSGQTLVLSDFRGHDGEDVRLGQPNFNDDDMAPIAGSGDVYCWAADAQLGAMLDVADEEQKGNGGDTIDLTPATYRPAGAMSGLVGSTLNGDWTLRVVDRWRDDNGFVFGWSLSFNHALVAACAK